LLILLNNPDVGLSDKNKGPHTNPIAAIIAITIMMTS